LSNYELTYILRPLEEANLTATGERITTIVQNAGGEIVARNDWGRRRLAYPIRKIPDGYYTTLYVKLPGASIRGIERSLQLIDDVQRYLVVRVDEFKLPAAPTETAAHPAEAPPVAAPAPASAAGASAVGASLAGASPAEASLAAVIPTEASAAEAPAGTTAVMETAAEPGTAPATTAEGS
jgi:small subunit ribosomal protein S6